MFTFKSFTIHQDRCAMKVGTDGVLLGAWAQGGSRILDIGTGTGIIAMMMAQRFPDADITAIDIDAEACKQAAENVRESVFKGRIIVKEEALQSYCRNHLEQQHPLYDSIVSNPPFFVNSLRNPDARRTAARHTDSLSFAELFRSVSRLLTDDGVFSAIIPTDNEKEFTCEGYLSGLYPARICQIKTTPGKQPKRSLIAFVRHRPLQTIITCENMLTATGEKSEWYKELTNDFYLDKD